MKTIKRLFILPVLLTVLTFAPGCEEGPAERTGEKIDNAAEKTKDAVKEGAEKTKDAVEKGADKVKDAVDK